MSLYVPVPASGVKAIGICDRCKMKMSLQALRADGDTPGLRVCKDCYDEGDPYDKPSKRSDNISLRHPRPDEPLIIPED